MTLLLLMAPPSTMKEESSNVATKPRSKPRRLRRGRRRNDTDNNFDQASEFLKHFHSYASRSLDAILEHPESEHDEDLPRFIRMEKQYLTKAQTCSCLSSLAAPSTERANQSILERYDDEWGFYFDDEPPDRRSSNERSK